MRAKDVREVFETILPDEILMPLVQETGFQERQRKLDSLMFLRSMVMAAGSPYGGRQATVMRFYFENGSEKVVRGSFYRWFNPALEKTMQRVSEVALEYVRKQPVDLPGVLGRHVSDWHIVDSTTILLEDDLKDVYPGCGDYGAIKVHKRFSVGVGTTIAYHFSPAREHDSQHLQIDESWRGLGLLADLGYASFARLQDCAKYGVEFVFRLKENWNPKVDFIAQGELSGTFFKGTDLDLLIAVDGLRLDGKPVDMDVHFGEKAEVKCRLVGIQAPDGKYRFYLTSLPRTIQCQQVSDMYRVRWEIEADNKLDKSCSQMDFVDCKTAHALRALIHASLVSSMIACLITHHHRLAETKPKRGKDERTVPPIHPQLLARMIGSMSMTIALAMNLQGKEAEKKWESITETLEHMGKDPNWRRRPSILDQLRGWKVQPAKPKKMKMEIVPVLWEEKA